MADDLTKEQREAAKRALLCGNDRALDDRLAGLAFEGLCIRPSEPAPGVDDLAAALEPFARAFDNKVQDPKRSQARRDWGEQMPGHWPIDLEVTMADGRRARTALAAYRGQADG